MNDSTRLSDCLLSVSLGFDARLLSYPNSLCHSFPARQRACSLSALCWGCHWDLCVMRRKDILQLQHSDSHSHCTSLPRSEVFRHIGEARRDNDDLFSGMVYSRRQETTKRSLPYPSHVPASGQWVYKVPLLPHVPCSLVSGFCALREVVNEHLNPTSQQMHQAFCMEALDIWASSHPPRPLSLSRCPCQQRTPLASDFPFCFPGLLQ